MRTLFRRAALVAILALGTATPQPADANPFSIIKALSKAAKVGSKGASTAGKAAKGAGAAAKAGGAAKVGAKGAAAAKVAIASGGLVAAERAGLLFKLVPDEAGRIQVYLTREGDDALSLFRRSGDVSETSEGAWYGAIDDLRTAEDPAVDVYLDTTAALDPPPLDDLTQARLFAVDKDGVPHPIHKKADDDGWELADGQDLAEFALEQIAEVALDTGLEAPDEPAPLEEPPDPAAQAAIAAERAERAEQDRRFMAGYGVFAFALVLLGVREYRKPTEFLPDEP